MAFILDVPDEFHVRHNSVEGILARWSSKLSVAPYWARLLGNVWPKQVTQNWRWVYLARRHEDGLLKVGISESPMARIAGLCRDARCGFSPVAAVPYCGSLHEELLLRVLQPYRVGRGREWFRNCQETQSFAWCFAVKRDPKDAEESRKLLPFWVKDSMRALGMFTLGRYVEPQWLGSDSPMQPTRIEAFVAEVA